jgi:hypothetical protein
MHTTNNTKIKAPTINNDNIFSKNKKNNKKTILLKIDKFLKIFLFLKMNDKDKEIAICRSLYLGRFKNIEEENENLRMKIESHFVDENINKIEYDEDVSDYFEEYGSVNLDLIIRTKYITIDFIQVMIEKYVKTDDKIFISYFEYGENDYDFAMINRKNNTYVFDNFSIDKQILDDYVFSRLNFFVMKYKKEIFIRNDSLDIKN